MYEIDFRGRGRRDALQSTKSDRGLKGRRRGLSSCSCACVVDESRSKRTCARSDQEPEAKNDKGRERGGRY
jgi:hypothetical protein